MKRGLGRGLGALLDLDEHAAGHEAVAEIAIENIDPDPNQPRKRYDKEKLEQLAASIVSVGIIQPMLVTAEAGRYRIVSGERRWRAARMAGLTSVPAIVRDMDTMRRMEVALVENLQRDDLNAMEEAEAVRRLMDECGLTQELVSQRLGRSRSAVANTLRLLDLTPRIQNQVREGKLTSGHARALTAIDPLEAEALADRIIGGGWSVRQVEDEMRKRAERLEKKPSGRAAQKKPTEFTDFEETASKRLGTRVSILGDGKHGSVVLHYYSPEQLQGIADLLLGE